MTHKLVPQEHTSITCDMCGEDLGPLNTTELDSMNAEYQKNFPEYADSLAKSVVCDECYEKVLSLVGK